MKGLGLNWHYEKAPLNGGAPGDAYKSVFNGSGKNDAVNLAREAIQNSVDAAADQNATVRVDFRFRRLEGDGRVAFEAAASLADIAKREPALGLPKSNAFRDYARPIDLLYVDDYGTVGLRGDPSHPSSNLRKLLLDLGGSGKAQNQTGSGGSYGFGKAVYSSNSRIGTIFAFSRTENAEGRPISLLMGCAYHAGHEHEDKPFTGRAFLGAEVLVPDEGIRFDPLQGEAAEAMAERLGFQREDGLGTSILLIDTAVQPEDLVAGIEDWWWPRIEARLLESSVFDWRGEEYVPRPKLRRHISPFIKAFDSATGKAPDITGQQQRMKFQKLDGRELGAVGAVVLDDSEDENPLGEEYEDRLDTVALVRGPLMVVDYHQNWRLAATAPRAVGCFVASPDVDEILKLSEPPAHDRWDPTAHRLKLDDDELPEVVASVLARIKTRFRDFQNLAKPPAPPRPRRLTKLERDLASWFGVGPKGPPAPPVPNPAPISLRPYGPQIEVDGDGLRATGHVEISLPEDSAFDDLAFRVRIILKVAEEEGMSGADPIPLTLDPDCNLEPIGDDLWQGLVTREVPARIAFRSDTYDPSWTVQLVPEVMPVEEGT